ncbi:ZN862 protein, partial [Acromyrmex heyeri]
ATIEAKTIDIKLTVHIAIHIAIRDIDHLTNPLRSLGSSLEKLRMHRTKCSKLISEVIAPALLADLISDIGDSSYSLIVDESTDLSVCKYLAFCIRYFSKKRQQIITDFLGCVSLIEASAIEYLATIKLDVKNIVGLGTDNASTMIGCNDSLYRLLRDRHIPELQLIPRMCHSLHLAASKASDELPSSLEFLIRETNSWFSCSPLRKSLYNSLYTTINKGAMNQQLVKLSKTRWLALSVTRILKPTFICSAFSNKHLNIQNLESIKKYLNQNDCLLSLDFIDYGDNFKIEAQQCKISEKALYEVKDRCKKFLRVLCIELANRLPTNVSVLEAVSNSVQFWVQMKKLTNAGGDHPFNELATFVLRILCLPFSNAAVERVFSHMNAIKIKPRNRLGFALLRIRIRLVVVDKCCCKDFEITEKMLKLFTSTIYETVKS